MYARHAQHVKTARRPYGSVPPKGSTRGRPDRDLSGDRTPICADGVRLTGREWNGQRAFNAAIVVGQQLKCCTGTPGAGCASKHGLVDRLHTAWNVLLWCVLEFGVHCICSAVVGSACSEHEATRDGERAAPTPNPGPVSDLHRTSLQ
jgi:hypothetical protein